MSKNLEFLFDFGGPNSYLAYKMLPDLCARTGAKVVYVPILLGGLFKLTNNQAPMMRYAETPAKQKYEMLEFQRFVNAHAIPFKMNPRFPLNTLYVMRGAIAAQRLGCFAPYMDAVMAAIVGAAGLSPCLAAARAGKRLLLANKEALVVGGEVFLSAVREGGATLLPIDSEHSAIFQSLPEDPATWQRRVHKIILTASGGPFRGRDPSTLKDVTPEQACAHPNWVMGRKISVDSATMMNKALEVIEARYLFGMSPDQLEVVIHPQSVIHSMVQYQDNSVVAQLGTPDMRVPIAYGLSWPERMNSGASALDFHALAAMTFEAMDDHGHPQRFPGLRLAWETLNGAPGSCALLNAANEIAVEAFLNRQIRFDQIHAVNRSTLDQLS